MTALLAVALLVAIAGEGDGAVDGGTVGGNARWVGDALEGSAVEDVTVCGNAGWAGGTIEVGGTVGR